FRQRTPAHRPSTTIRTLSMQDGEIRACRFLPLRSSHLTRKKNGPGCQYRPATLESNTLHSDETRLRSTRALQHAPRCDSMLPVTCATGITSLLLRLALLDALASDLEFDATVALAARRGVVGVHGIGLAETLDRGDAAGRDAVRGQVSIDDVGATLGQTLVVLLAA